MTNLIRAEFIKIFKRWNQWVMLFLLLLFQNIPVLIVLIGKFQSPFSYYLPK